jgi:NRAMP (natural resistance-associated macrophage protein)-like metal ion transporter
VTLNTTARPGVRLAIRGRILRLPGITAPRSGVLALLSILGPGLIAATAGDDAGGIATYSQVGARYGYELLWVLVIITVTLALVQEMCARLGAATGRGLLELVRERFGIAWALFAVVVVLIANGGVIITEFLGIGAAAELFGVSRYLAVPAAALVVWYFVIGGSYSSVEKVFLLMALAFLTYPVAVVLARPDLGGVARGTFVPSLRADPNYLSLLVALIGTTVTPYMQLFQQSSVVEKGVARRHYGPERADAYFGAVFSNVIAALIVIAAGATLHVAGITDVQTAEDAARALEPIAGTAAQVVFGIGLLGASMLAAGVLPLATSYSVSEAFGFRKGVNLDFRRAPIFIGIFSVLVFIGAGVALIPDVPTIALLVGIQTLNGVLLPVILVFILLLVNDRHLVVESMRNSRVYNILGWGSVVLVGGAAGALVLDQVLGLFGLGFLS